MSNLELSFGLIVNAIENCTAAILITDRDAIFHYANERFYQLISLSERRLLPIQKLKINESLTPEIELDPLAAQVVKAIVSLASVLNIDTITDGVSSETQLRILREIGCL
ncbi:EAL domain-containing protein [Vibrio sp. ZSDZ34]|uniref:EAL domain-containing protein n=1 Tax=Vibrio gelatinilyticus TaxID=2893468 RepID=A0A9X1WDC9_9VIBR|nr:EAL domain-containing protein [Vibrio gelatinilyticus]MCJ2378244.1 EAL domain-containing protein [Vibrio gelatinilyticus]